MSAKQQVLVIHGGTSFDSNEEYLDFIKTRELTLEMLVKESIDWRFSLARELGSKFEVLLPKMPNATNARYKEWCVWFSRCSFFVKDNAILIGHSLGGIFLAKYLSEHSFPKKIIATILVSAPFDATSTVESLKDFALPVSLQQLESQMGILYLIHSEDDPIVSVEQIEKYQQAFPSAHTIMFKDRGHFRQEVFPELVTLIRSL